MGLLVREPFIWNGWHVTVEARLTDPRSHCHRWYPVMAVPAEGTAFTVAMRYFECRGNRYYAGQEGQVEPPSYARQCRVLVAYRNHAGRAECFTTPVAVATVPT
jgi:hypothetical protein